ncbi:SDR family NAD(P)-dependent oxidoreductase [Rhodopila globiformis]|uniref:Short-chain dehydrogenase n=1 Tax=Rhodopila globiformis TaxID=1071 RepID=A0A2S6NKI6_RHOGL|nr:SDR family oxidoreductase [Rhodopila globiformis]PPQ35604.1 short-chain dehydrogenase [Rhodopila globiformis]
MTALSGRAVVAGGASGIGAACCRVLARCGASVVVLDRHAQNAEAIAREVGGEAVLADVGDEASVRDAAQRIERNGPVAFLINSAGIIQRPVPPEGLPLDRWDDIVRIDQRGTYLTCVAFGEAMARRRQGAIVNIASVVGMRSAPLHAYAPAKAAVIAITECLAAEWGPMGVRVNAVSPGYTRTPALQGAIDAGERDVSLLTRYSALGRLVEPDDIARACAFLLSEDAAAITGINLPVDCGWLVSTSWATYGGLRQRN